MKSNCNLIYLLSVMILILPQVISSTKHSARRLPSVMETLINQETTHNQKAPDTVLLTDGRFIIVYVDEQMTPDSQPLSCKVMAAVFQRNGIRQGTDIVVQFDNPANSWCGHNPVVSALPNGGFIVAWRTTS